MISGSGPLELIANGDLTGTATGGVSLGGVNTFTGTTTITAGMVQAQSSFGSAANQVVLDGGGLLAAGGTRGKPTRPRSARPQARCGRRARVTSSTSRAWSAARAASA